MVEKDDGVVLKRLTDQPKDTDDTTVIRISNENYESLRERAFYNRTSIRYVADEILKKELHDSVT